MDDLRYALCSGGKDSITMTNVLAEQGRLAGVVFFDTGIGVPDLLPFIKQMCESRGWNLLVYKSKTSYEDYVRRYGFPGPSQHSAVMNILKGRCVRMFKKEHKGDILASGVRHSESKRRMKSVSGKYSVLEGVKVEAPIWDWTTDRVWAYIRQNGLEVSPAYWKLHISGDCLCGAYAQKDEPMMLRMFYPELADRIAILEETVRKEGVVRNEKCRKWGCGCGLSGTAKQSKMESFLCQSCTST